MSFVFFFLPAIAFASDSRMALLVGNQHGWKGDPQLQYALSGDILPLATTLRSLGFQVKVLSNQNADQLRTTLQHLKQKLEASQSIDTFLFYYSGHSDKKYLHLGKKGERPFSYQEFSSWFRQLKLKRRIAIFDSCFSGELIRQFGSLKKYHYLVKNGRHKGVRRIRKVNIRNLLLPNQGSEEGMRVISSSLLQAWELKHLKASVFTHYLLKGLKGEADLDRDGKISVDELFDFTSQRVQQKTGQKPQQLLMLKRNSPYAFAPSYQSRMVIGSKVHGNLKIRVGNFVWSKQKKESQALRLSVVHGNADVFLKRKEQCFHQSLRIPKGREVTLRAQWRPIRCQQIVKRSKGNAMIRMPAQDFVQRPTEFSPVLSLGGGFVQQGASDIRSGNALMRLGLRQKFWGISLEMQSTKPENKQFSLTRFQIHGELGWTWNVLPQWTVFTGAYLGLGPIWAHSPGRSSAPALTFSTGAKVDMSFWFFPRWGVRLGGSAGLDYLQLTSSTDNGINFSWALRAAALYRF